MHRFLTACFGIILPLAIAASAHSEPLRTQRSRPRGACAGMRAQNISALTGKRLAPGRYLVRVDRAARFDLQLVAGGGGGGGSRAAKEAPGGGGGNSAQFKPIFQGVRLERDYYLLGVGKGGEGGRGGWNWREPPSRSQGADGGSTLLSRCSSGAVIAGVAGGAGGGGDAATGDGRGNPGRDLVDPNRRVPIGRGGAGGTGGSHGGDGGDATGYGSGGGGQGATLFQNNGKSHGGRGADGFARFDRIG